jgi:hypothetical protein
MGSTHANFMYPISLHLQNRRIFAYHYFHNENNCSSFLYHLIIMSRTQQKSKQFTSLLLLHNTLLFLFSNFILSVNFNLFVVFVSFIFFIRFGIVVLCMHFLRFVCVSASLLSYHHPHAQILVFSYILTYLKHNSGIMY